MSSFDTTMSNIGVNRKSTTPTVTSGSANATLDQSDFLALMTAQLKNQDPFEPVDNTQMVAQMAQFSSLAGISEMNTTLKALSEKLSGTTMNDALGWVGRTVLTEGDTAYPRTTGGFEGAIEIDKDASDIDVVIEDQNGQILKTVSLGPRSKGTVDFDWDGTTDSGEEAGAGPFKIRLAAQGTDGGSIAARSLVWAPVTSVSLVDGEPNLTLPGIGQIKSSEVRKVG